VLFYERLIGSVVATNDSNVPDKEHDKVYRDFLSNAEAFLYFLKTYVYKDEDWIKDIDPKNVVNIKTTFVTEEYKTIDADLIYRLKMSGDEDVYFYVLLESQSTVDFSMPLRLLKYMTAMFDYLFQNTPKNERECKDFRLPAVIPIVSYNGKDNWTAVRSFKEYTKDHGRFGENILDFTYLLFDLNRVEEHKTENSFDLVLEIDKMRLNKVNLEKIAAVLTERAPKLKDDSNLDILVRWLSNVVFIGQSPSEIKETIKTGGSKMMEHSLDVAVAELKKEVAEENAMRIAEKMLKLGDSVEKVATVTDLDISVVLKLKAEL